MTVIESRNKEIALIVDVNEKRATIYSAIDNDSSLIRYLTDILCLNTVSVENEYLKLRREDRSKTTLHRIILEFYSIYNNKLKGILEDKRYEINHINKITCDNRLENLEIVTHENNILHRDNKEYKAIMTSEELINIQNEVKSKAQYLKDTMLLDNINSIFDRIIENKRMSIKQWLDNKYYRSYCYDFSNNIKILDNKLENITRGNKEDIKEYKNILPKITKIKLQDIFYENSLYVVDKIFRRNNQVLKVARKRYKYIDEVCKKYNLNLALGELYTFLTKCSNKFLIIDDNILFYYSMNTVLHEIRGKYKSLKILYLLGLLNMENPVKTKRNQPSTISMSICKSEQMIEVNKISKKILELNLNKITYFIIRQALGQAIADNIYKNKQGLLKYKYDKLVKIKDDVIDILKDNIYLKENGYISTQQIYDELFYLNEIRKGRNEEYSEICPKLIDFIKSLLNYNSDLKERMEKIGLKYIALNKSTINKIQDYSKSKGGRLKSICRFIVLKKLIVKQ